MTFFLRFSFGMKFILIFIKQSKPNINHEKNNPNLGYRGYCHDGLLR